MVMLARRGDRLEREASEIGALAVPIVPAVPTVPAVPDVPALPVAPPRPAEPPPPSVLALNTDSPPHPAPIKIAAMTPTARLVMGAGTGG